ncbi:MAG: TRAP transporter substrate-binding protein DctP [Acidobacteriota bacterium]
MSPSLLKSYRSLGIVALVCLLLSPTADARTLVKMASLAPDGSVWAKILKDMGAEWQEQTEGEVSLRLYGGGVAGNEADVVRKMRVGQLQAAALTVSGLSTIDDGFEIFEIPMFFESYDELFHVLEKTRPQLEKRLLDKGYVMLNYGQAGWIHIFSKKPVQVVEDLRQLKIFSVADNEGMLQLWRRNGFQPVSLAVTDMLTGLQTGMIEAMPTTPLAALSLQWFRQTPYMQNLGLAPLVGATVITERAWKRLSPEHQAALKATGLKTEQRLMKEIPEQDEQAVEQMKQRGMTVIEVTPEQEKEWRQVAEQLVDYRLETMKAKDLLELARKERDAYRASR